jgi:NAD(P)-dependent dehydrogenase (short-subunit alcohol dehydrogenase family)
MSLTIDLDRRAYVVAGAGGGGIGTAIAAMLAKAGATVIAVDRTEIGLKSAAEGLAPYGDWHQVVDCDLSDQAGTERMLADMSAKAGPIRGAVNVVGGMMPHHWTALTDPLAPDSFDDVMRFNLKPTLITATVVARAIVAHGLGGSIVNVSSAAGLVSMAYGAGYAAAKAALINLTRSMAVEWGRYQLRVNAVAPGTIRTKKLGRARFDTHVPDAMEKLTRDVIPLGRRGEPDDIGGAVLYLLSDLSTFVSGQVLAVDGGALARAPYTDGDNLPVFVTDPKLRARLTGEETS